MGADVLADFSRRSRQDKPSPRRDLCRTPVIIWYLERIQRGSNNGQMHQVGTQGTSVALDPNQHKQRPVLS